MSRKSLKYLVLAATIVLIATLLYQLTRSRKYQLFGNIVSRVETTQKVVMLTLDDGPGPGTDSLLSILDRYHVKATFFLTGSEINGNPELARKIVSAGHAIGNHSWSHQRMIFRSREFIEQEVEKTDSIIRALGVTGEIYFRPPYGKKFIYLPWYLKQTGRTTVTWDVEPDWAQETANDTSRILENFRKNVRPGSIILLHGMYPVRRTTVEALPHIIKWLQQNGYTLVTLHEMLKK